MLLAAATATTAVWVRDSRLWCVCVCDVQQSYKHVLFRYQHSRHIKLKNREKKKQIRWQNSSLSCALCNTCTTVTNWITFFFFSLDGFSQVMFDMHIQWTIRYICSAIFIHTVYTWKSSNGIGIRKHTYLSSLLLLFFLHFCGVHKTIRIGRFRIAFLCSLAAQHYSLIN